MLSIHLEKKNHNMDRSEALYLLERGEKLTHKFFLPYEYIYIYINQ